MKRDYGHKVLLPREELEARLKDNVTSSNEEYTLVNLLEE